MQCVNRMPAVLQVRRLAAVLLTMRLAVLPAEAAAPLKLLEKGVSKEALAGLVRPGRLDSFPAGCTAIFKGRAAEAAGERRQQGGIGGTAEWAAGIMYWQSAILTHTVPTSCAAVHLLDCDWLRGLPRMRGHWLR